MPKAPAAWQTRFFTSYLKGPPAILWRLNLSPCNNYILGKRQRIYAKTSPTKQPDMTTPKTKMTAMTTTIRGHGFTYTSETQIPSGTYEGWRHPTCKPTTTDVSYLIKVRWDVAKSKFILTSESGQEAEFEPQSENFYQDVQWYFLHYSDLETSIERALDVRDRLESHAEDIWTTLSSKDFLAYRTLSHIQAPVTIYIEEDLQSSPPKDLSFGILWELLELKRTAELDHPTYRVVRIASSRSKRESAAASGPGGENVPKNHLRILLVVARNLNEPEIDPQLISKPIFQLKKGLPPIQAAMISLQILRPGTLEALKAKLEDASKREIPFDIVHFDVHGDIDEEKNV